MAGKLHPVIRKWRENMKKPVKRDADFEAFLEQEAKEIDEILASLEGPKPRNAAGFPPLTIK